MRRLRLPLWLYSRWARRVRAGCAVLLLTVALLSALPRSGQRTSGAPPGGTAVPVAAHDLDGGTVLGPADVRVAHLPVGAVPAGVLPSATAAVGRTLAGAMRRGEPLTDARVVGTRLAILAGGPGTLVVPVRLVDPGVAALLRPGDRVDVIAVGQSGGGNVVVSAAPVLAVPANLGGATTGSTVEGALVVLAVPAYLAVHLSSAALTARLTVTLRPP
jgi:pilus assembly protein CpaB